MAPVDPSIVISSPSEITLPSSNMIILEPGYPYANTNQRFAIKPKDGGCVAFPGHIPHFVEPNPSDNRLILSTNLEFIKGGKNV